MKDIPVDIFRALNLAFGAPLVGALIAEQTLILPLIRRLHPADGVAALDFVSSRAWKWTPVCGQISVFSGTAVIALWRWDRSSAAALTIAGAALSYVAILITYAAYRPADRRVRGLPADVAPGPAHAAMRTMARLNAIRTVFYAAGFVCFVLAVVLD